MHSDLTIRGQDHAREQGNLLRELGDEVRDLPIYVSPQGRTRQTAELALASIGRHAVADQRLVELCCGDFETRSLKELEAEQPGTIEKRNTDPFAWYFNLPRGESVKEMETRARDFLDDLTGPAIVITHGVTSRFLRAVPLGLSPREAWKLPVDQGCIYHVKDGVHRVIS